MMFLFILTTNVFASVVVWFSMMLLFILTTNIFASVVVLVLNDVFVYSSDWWFCRHLVPSRKHSSIKFLLRPTIAPLPPKSWITGKQSSLNRHQTLTISTRQSDTFILLICQSDAF